MPDAETQAAADLKRKRLYAKIVAFLVIVLIAWLKPRVEAWLAENKTVSEDVAATEPANDSGPLGRPSESISISDPEDATDDQESGAASKEIVSDLRDQIATAAKEAGGASKEPAPKPAKDNAAKPSPGKTSLSEKPTTKKPTSVEVSTAETRKTGSAKTASTSTTSKPSQTTEKKSRPLPKMATPPGTSKKATAGNDRTNPSRSSSQSKSASREDDEPPGKLTLVRGTRDEFRSTAGLLYVPGSADGHRLKHVLEHAKDNTNKPVHGVFDGDREQITAWIDLAYLKAKKGGKGTRTENQGGRTVYTVDLGEKIGFVGGQVGKRKGHPPCRYLRLVIQNRNEVVTAYPSQSL